MDLTREQIKQTQESPRIDLDKLPERAFGKKIDIADIENDNVSYPVTFFWEQTQGKEIPEGVIEKLENKTVEIVEEKLDEGYVEGILQSSDKNNHYFGLWRIQE